MRWGSRRNPQYPSAWGHHLRPVDWSNRLHRRTAVTPATDTPGCGRETSASGQLGQEPSDPRRCGSRLNPQRPSVWGNHLRPVDWKNLLHRRSSGPNPDLLELRGRGRRGPVPEHTLGTGPRRSGPNPPAHSQRVYAHLLCDPLLRQPRFEKLLYPKKHFDCNDAGAGGSFKAIRSPRSYPDGESLSLACLHPAPRRTKL